MARLLDGRPVAREILAAVRAESAAFVTQTRRPPELAAILAGDDPSAEAYLRAIKRSFARAAIVVREVRLAATIPVGDFRETATDLNLDPTVNGVIALVPLPGHLPPGTASETIDPDKDVDGVTPVSLGRLAVGLDALPPGTPAGGMEILRYYNVPLAGQHAVVVGRSAVVGKPMALMLLAADATVTICHSRTTELGAITRSADILAVAAGRPGLVTPDMVKPGATIVDFGVTVVGGRIVGDVDPAAVDVAAALTPVPGGTGAVTTAILARNTLRAAWKQIGVWPATPAVGSTR